MDANSSNPAVRDFFEYSLHESVDSIAPMADEISVIGRRRYWAGSTIDGAGIWVGEQAEQITTRLDGLIAEHPGVGVALSVANVGLAIAGGPVRFAGGLLLESLKESVTGWIANRMEGPDLWSPDKARAGGSGIVLAGGIVLGGLGALRRGVGAAGGGGPKLLPGEGRVGTYDDLIAAGAKGNNITPHHIPSRARIELEGVSRGDGIAINMEQPVPGVGGRHRATFTYGTQADIAMTPREALAAGIWDARRIYRADGLYTPQIRSSLQDVIRMNKTNHPTIFVK